MKKKILFALLAPLAISSVHADEGMWTLYNLPQAVYEQMKNYGYELPYDKLYQADDAIMHAVVNFSGYCSGVVVSPDGLVFTNHHCGGLHQPPLRFRIYPLTLYRRARLYAERLHCQEF